MAASLAERLLTAGWALSGLERWARTLLEQVEESAMGLVPSALDEIKWGPFTASLQNITTQVDPALSSVTVAHLGLIVAVDDNIRLDGDASVTVHVGGDISWDVDLALRAGQIDLDPFVTVSWGESTMIDGRIDLTDLKVKLDLPFVDRIEETIDDLALLWDSISGIVLQPPKEQPLEIAAGANGRASLSWGGEGPVPLALFPTSVIVELTGDILSSWLPGADPVSIRAEVSVDRQGVPKCELSVTSPVGGNDALFTFRGIDDLLGELAEKAGAVRDVVGGITSIAVRTFDMVPTSGTSVEAIAQLSIDVPVEVGPLQTRANRPARLGVGPVKLKLELAVPPKATWDLSDATVTIEDPGAWTLEGAGAFAEALVLKSVRVGTSDGQRLVDAAIGFAADLGFVRLGPANALLPLLGGRASLSAFEARVDVPGFDARGRVHLSDGAFEGSIDADLSTLGLHVDASLSVDRGFVMVDGGVAWPVGVPLLATGLGIFGVRGGFVANGRRTIADSGPIPVRELQWWSKANHEKWASAEGSWGFGFGVNVGTMWDSASTLAARGMVVVVAGHHPAMVLAVDATILTGLQRTGDQLTTRGKGSALTGITSIGRDAVAMAIQGDLSLFSFLTASVPISSEFGNDDGLFGRVFVGDDNAPPDRTLGPVTVALDLGAFNVNAWAFFMAASDDLPNFGGTYVRHPVDVGGPAVGLGAGFDLDLPLGPFGLTAYGRGLMAIGVDPALIFGHLAVGGEIDLLIASVGVSASVEAAIGRNATGQNVSRFSCRLCGKVSLLFFTVKACLKFDTGTDPAASPPPPPVAALRCIGRLGRVSKYHDGETLRDAVTSGDTKNPPIPTVWADALPTLEFRHVPTFAPGVIGAQPGADDRFWTYTATERAELGGTSDRPFSYHVTALRLIDIDRSTGTSTPVSNAGGLTCAWARAANSARPGLQLLHHDPLEALRDSEAAASGPTVGSYQDLCDERGTRLIEWCAHPGESSDGGGRFRLRSTSGPVRDRLVVLGSARVWSSARPNFASWWQWVSSTWGSEGGWVRPGGMRPNPTDPTAFVVRLPAIVRSRVDGQYTFVCHASSGADLRYREPLADPQVTLLTRADVGREPPHERLSDFPERVGVVGVTSTGEVRFEPTGDSVGGNWLRLSFRPPLEYRNESFLSLRIVESLDHEVLVERICGTFASEFIEWAGTAERREATKAGLGRARDVVLRPGHQYRIEVESVAVRPGKVPPEGWVAPAAPDDTVHVLTPLPLQTFDFVVAEAGTTSNDLLVAEDTFDPRSIDRYVEGVVPDPAGPAHFRLDPCAVDWLLADDHVASLVRTYDYRLDTKVDLVFPTSAPVDVEKGFDRSTRQSPVHTAVQGLPAFAPGGCLSDSEAPNAASTNLIRPSLPLAPNSTYEVTCRLEHGTKEPTIVRRWTFRSSCYLDPADQLQTALGTTHVLLRTQTDIGVAGSELTAMTPGPGSDADWATVAAAHSLPVVPAIGLYVVVTPSTPGSYRLLGAALVSDEPLVRPGRLRIAGLQVGGWSAASSIGDGGATRLWFGGAESTDIAASTNLTVAVTFRDAPWGQAPATRTIEALVKLPAAEEVLL